MTETVTSQDHLAAGLPAWAWPSRDDPYARKRTANDYMRDGLRRLDPDELIPFFCECDLSDCFAAVWLSGGRFDEIRAGTSAGVVSGLHAEAAAA